MRAFPATPRRRALDRLDWSVPDGTDAVIVELGANDALRGLDPAGTAQGARRDRDAAQGARHRGDARGHVAPRNLGADYVQLVRQHLSRACRQARRAALPVLPRRRRRRSAPTTCPTACTPTAEGVRDHRRAHPADRRGLPAAWRRAADPAFPVILRPRPVTMGRLCCAGRAPGLPYSPSHAARCML